MESFMFFVQDYCVNVFQIYCTATLSSKPVCTQVTFNSLKSVLYFNIYIHHFE